MKMMKNVFAIVLAMAMILCLCACGNDDSSSTEGTNASTTAPTTEATEPSTEATEPSTEATEPSTEATEPSTEATEPSTEATDPSTEPTVPEYLYAITVKSVDGQLFNGVFVQLCRGDSCCSMGTTGDDGTAYYVEELVGEGPLTAKIIVCPEGYQCIDGVQQIELADGVNHVEFVLEPVAG